MPICPNDPVVLDPEKRKAYSREPDQCPKSEAFFVLEDLPDSGDRGVGGCRLAALVSLAMEAMAAERRHGL